VQIQTNIEGGQMVGWVPGTQYQAVVRLSRVARDLASKGRVPTLTAGDYDELDALGTSDEVGWRFGRRLKKAFKKVKRVAKKIVKNKIVKSLYKAVKMVTPPPASLYIQGVETAVKFGKALAKGNRKAKALAPSIRKAAAGKLSPKQLDARAKKAGVSPALARKAAAGGRVLLMAKQGDAKARGALALATRIEDAKKGGKRAVAAKATVAELALRSKYPNARAFNVTSAKGRGYRTIVVPA
jgi:hypothetical protein